MKRLYKFKVSDEIFTVAGETAGDAMQWINRNVMDGLNKGPWAWHDSLEPKKYDFYAVPGNFFD